MNEIVSTILYAFLTAFILPIITWAGKTFIQWMQAKVHNETLKKHLTLASETIVNAVNTVAQTYVDELKKAGTFDEESAKKAFESAKQLTLQSLTAETKNYLAAHYGDLDVWLKSHIESAVKNNKT